MDKHPKSFDCTEDDILDLAIRRGYITRELIEEIQTVYMVEQSDADISDRIVGPRIVHLLQSGSLDNEILSEIMSELGIPGEDQATLLIGKSDSGNRTVKKGDSGVRSGGLTTGSRISHFRIERVLGRGGMGVVYLAWDETLERPVALKFLHGETPDQERRFMREARTQAKIDHAHVCKVYEVGEAEGRPYIAMQYIEGRTLQEVSRTLTLDGKVALMAKVADALHAAHERGLIHRDLKPANIMVQDGEEGLMPFVLDFGLSKEIEAPNITHSGIIAGTPTYMAPEQASGRGADLDRRTDVYGLGATLYDIVAGGAPFQGNSTVDILMKVIQQDPIPLSRHQPKIPGDLETIIMKCLEKDPSRRYENSRALAEDLRRFLKGEPILARRASIAEKTWKRVKRHPTVSTAIGVLVLALVLLGIHALWSSHTNQLRRTYDQTFDREVAFVEETLRFAFTSPLHDIGPERDKVLNRLTDLEERIERESRLAKPSGYYALGRGYLDLGDWNRALEFLQKAWDQGNRRPESAYALGRALGEVYFEELSQLEGIRDRELREKRRKELEVEYRIPAITYLNASQGMDIASPAFVEGLILYYEKRYDQAIARVEEAIQEVPWLYEARSLKGRILRAMAEKSLEEGKTESGVSMMENAMIATQSAVATAPSDPGSLLDLCRLRTGLLKFPVFIQENNLDALMNDATSACEQAMTADPTSPLPSTFLAMAWRARAYTEVGRGVNPAESLARAESHARHSLEVRPGHLMSRLELSNIYQVKEERALMVGGDRATLIDASIDLLEQILKDKPDYVLALNEIGSAYLRKARLLRDRGENPVEYLNRAIDAYHQRLETSPDNEKTLYNLGLTYEELAKVQMDREQDPTRALDEALQSYTRLTGINPANISAHQSVGTVYRLKAEYAISLGEDALPMLEQSIHSLEKATSLGPSNRYIFNSLGNTQLYLADQRARVGQDPVPDYRNAIESYRRELQNNPTFMFSYNNIGETYVHWARYELSMERNPSGLLESAKTALNESLKLNAKRATPYFVLGSASGVEAEYLLSRGSNPDPAVNRALSYFHQGLAINPAILQAYVDAVKILAFSLTYGVSHDRSVEKMTTEAMALLDRALERNNRYAEALLWRAKVRILSRPTGKGTSDVSAIEADLRSAEELDPSLHEEILELRK